jgi:prophage maintenance system killer protein
VPPCTAWSWTITCPLPDGNKRAAYLSMIEFIRRNDGLWVPRADVDERAEMVERLAADDLTEDEFAAWVRDQVG